MSNFHPGRPEIISGFSQPWGDLTHFPFSYEYYLQPAWIRRCCPCSYRYVIAKEVLSCICQKMKDWGFIKLDGLVGTPSCQVGARTFDRALLSWCKGCQRLLKVSTKYRQLRLCARKGPFQVRTEEPWQNCVGNPARHLPSGFPSPICANIWLFQGCFIHS